MFHSGIWGLSSVISSSVTRGESFRQATHRSWVKVVIVHLSRLTCWLAGLTPSVYCRLILAMTFHESTQVHRMNSKIVHLPRLTCWLAVLAPPVYCRLMLAMTFHELRQVHRMAS